MNSNLHSSAASLTETSNEQTGLVPAALAAPACEEAGRGRGRPPVLTGELAAKMYKLIRLYGLSDSRAGLLAGVSTSSVSRWKEEDPEFRDYLETARAEFEVNRTRKLLEAARPDGSPDWRAHAWLLKNSQRGEGQPPGRPRQECEGVPVSECASETAVAPSSAGTPGGEMMRQKIPENAASSHSPALEVEPGGGNMQRIPENGVDGEKAALARPAAMPGAHEKIPENPGSSALEVMEEAA